MWWLLGGSGKRILRCRDAARYGHRLEVRPQPGPVGPRVGLVLDSGEPLLLDVMQVGWLREELRATLLVAAQQCAKQRETSE